MAKIEPALVHVFNMEGGFVNHSDDPGGATNYGVTQKTFDQYNRVEGRDTYKVSRLTKFEAREIYKKMYWDQCNLDHVDAQNLATMVFDQAVNCGPQVSALRLQWSLNNTVRGAQLATDGVLGKKTIAIINQQNNTYNIKKEFLKQTYLYYAKIVKRGGKWNNGFVSFIHGWTKRANHLMDLLRAE